VQVTHNRDGYLAMSRFLQILRLDQQNPMRNSSERLSTLNSLKTRRNVQHRNQVLANILCWAYLEYGAQIMKSPEKEKKSQGTRDIHNSGRLWENDVNQYLGMRLPHNDLL
jgi:hypothetical protein